jgi:hypothetical protein
MAMNNHHSNKINIKKITALGDAIAPERKGVYYRKAHISSTA